MIPPEIKRLFHDHGAEVDLGTGEVLFRQGDASDAVYYVKSGRLTVYKMDGDADPLPLNSIGAGELLGELGAITLHPRSATLIAASPVVLSCIPTLRFRALLADTLSLVEAITSTNRDHLISADKARIQYGKAHQQMQKRVAKLGEEKEQLQELLRLREELEVMVVHDLRNPLNAVTVALDLLEQMKNQIADPLSFALVTRMAKGATQRMNQLITTLLDIVRLEAGKLVLNITEFDLSALLGEVIETAQAMVTESVELTNRASPVLMVRADRDILWRVLANLLDNAIKFAPPASRIEIVAQVSKGRDIRIDITDAGPGVPPGDRERIFEKFTQVKDPEHEKRSGTGLGLTFCRMAVEAHGGAIWVEEGPSGVGSRFSVTLPQG